MNEKLNLGYTAHLKTNVALLVRVLLVLRYRSNAGLLDSDRLSVGQSRFLVQTIYPATVGLINYNFSGVLPIA